MTPKQAIQKQLNQLNLLVDRQENALFIGFHVNNYLNKVARLTCEGHISVHDKDDYNNHERLDLLRAFARENKVFIWEYEATYCLFKCAEESLGPLIKEYPKLIHRMPQRQALFD